MTTFAPSHWATAMLGDILTLINGRAYKQEEMLMEGTPILRIQNLNGGSKWFYSNLNLASDKYCDSGDLLYAWSATFGPYIYTGQRAIFHYHIWNVIPSEAIHKKFAFYELMRVTADIKRTAHGVAMPHVTKGGMEAWEIRLPPLSEQTRIADKLDALLARVDAARGHLDRVPALLKRFRQSVLAAAVSGELTQEWRGGKEAEWKYLRATDICGKVQSGGTPKEGFVESGVPFLKVYNIVGQKVSFDYRPQYITANIHSGSMAKSIVKPGDVLMNIVGPPLGKVAVVPDTYVEWNINQAITLFRPSDLISTGWLYCVLCGGKNIEEIVHETKGMVGQQNISLSQCRNFVFPVPSTEEQTEIIRRVEVLFALADNIQAQYEAARARVDKLTPALLAKAFRGELVPQDPNDEPASVLLERLRATQGDAKPAAKRGRRARAT